MSQRAVDGNLQRYIVVREVENASALADPIFQRRYRSKAPDFPIHVLGFYRAPAGSETPVCYIHFTERGDLMLGGGACVDDRVLRRMVPEARAAIRHAGGLYKHALAWSLRALAPRCKAVFGFCGDALAERADLAVGFSRTAHPNLLVYFTRELEGAERERLVAEAHAVGPF